MIFKMAVSNIKKSYKDYAIYFITLMFSIIIFFIVNALSSEIGRQMFNDPKNIKSFEDTFGLVVAIITFTLLFLIIYANQFIMKRRYKELGLYTLFGLSKSKVIKIVSIETILVGIVSLTFGLIFGFILSQIINNFAMSFFLGGNNFKLTFDTSAFTKTITAFGIIFLITIIFNALYVGKNKLINLFNSDKKAEMIYKPKLVVSLLLLVISITIFGYLYNELLRAGDFSNRIQSLWIYIVFGIIATFVLYYALSGLFMFIISINKKRYYKSLNLFTFNLLSQKMRTHFISLSIISLLLFFGIAATSLALSLKNSTDDEIKKQFPEDVLIIDQNSKISNFNEEVAKTKFDLVLTRKIELKTTHTEGRLAFTFMSKSNYEEVTKEKVQLETNEYLLSGVEEEIKVYKENFNQANLDLKFRDTKTKIINSNSTVVIVNDEVYQKLNALSTRIIYSFNDPSKKYNDIKIGSSMKENPIWSAYPELSMVVFNSMMKNAVFMMQFTVIVTGIYFSSVLILSGITMIALQQLSAAKDSEAKYRIVNYLGASKNSVKKSVLLQVGIYFIVPLLFGIGNSYVAMKFISNGYEQFTRINLMNYVYPVFVIISIGYLIYGYVTYRTYFKTVYNTQKKVA